MASWWAVKLAKVDDPISLEPLRKLRYEPFECKADPNLPHSTESDWFDGQVLAAYLCSSASFAHPISRRAITRAECQTLDEYCSKHSLSGPHVTAVYDAAEMGDASIAQHRAEADSILQSLFRRTADHRNQAHVRLSEWTSRGNESSVIDDDLRPSQQPHDPGTTLDGSRQEVDAFPPLIDDQHMVKSAPSGSWSGNDRRSLLAQPMPPEKPPRPPLTADEAKKREQMIKQQKADYDAAIADGEPPPEPLRLEYQRSRIRWQCNDDQKRWTEK